LEHECTLVTPNKMFVVVMVKKNRQIDTEFDRMCQVLGTNLTLPIFLKSMSLC